MSGFSAAMDFLLSNADKAEAVLGKNKADPARDCLINFLLWDIERILESGFKLSILNQITPSSVQILLNYSHAPLYSERSYLERPQNLPI